MYLEFFGLREKPFGLTPDPKFLFFSEKHREALDHLLYGIHQKEGFVLISGDTGTGKTTLCRALLERLDPREVSTSLILNPLLNGELLKAILEDFGLPSAGTTKKELLDMLNRFLLKTLAAGRTAVLIIDEAQHLSTACLEQVRLLSNLETHKEKLIQIILVGSEELPAKLESFELRHLQQRISLRYHLRPLDRRETRSYLQHRLNMARAAGSTSFDTGAHREIYRFSKGVPRLINIIAERSLLAAYVAESRKIRHAHVVEGRQSLNGRFPRSRPRQPLLRLVHSWREASIALSVLVTASVLVFVPTIREMLGSYLNQGYTQRFFAPLNYSRQFVRAEIPQPKPAVRKSPAQREKSNVTYPLQLDKDSSGEKTRGIANSRARPAVEDEIDDSRTTAVTEPNTRTSKERFPQYLLKPPYVYTVQVESFKDPEIAAARMGELQSRGFNAWVAWIDLGEMGTWYRVLVGKYKAKDEAQVMARKLSQKSEFQRARQIATHKESPKGQGAKKD